MRNFLIGQHGSFSESKQQRDFKKDFYGVQGCQFDNEEEIGRLLKEAKEKNFKIAVHFPLRAGVFNFRDPLVTSSDDVVRAEAFAAIENELEFLKEIKPSYVLIHYPKPVILDDMVDWSNWRIGSSEYVFESNYSYEELKEKSEHLFKWLTEKSEEYDFVPVLEFDALNKYIYENTFLEELLDQYPKVRVCLDTGRLHLQNMLDPNFHAEGIIRRFTKYTEVVHLWNTKVTDKVEYHHYPVLPWLDPAEGWGPIGRYLEIIREENENCLMMFEHRSDLLTDEELKACYKWVDDIINKG